MDPTTQLSDTHARILNLLRESPGYNQAGLARVLDKSPGTISPAVEKLEDLDLIHVERGGQGESNILELTREGKLLTESVGGPESKGGGQDQDAVSLHNFSVRFDLRGARYLEDGWRERFIQGKTQRYQYDPTNGSYVYWRESWRFRITGEHVIIRLEDELRGQDPVNLKDRALAQVFEAREWLQQHLPDPARIGTDPEDFRIWVNRQHLALVEDPFCQLVDQYSPVELDDVKIFDQDGTERLWLDNSNGEHHLEGGNAPGENREYAEDDVEFLKSELYEWLIDNKDEWETLQALASVVNREKERQENRATSERASTDARERTLSDELEISSTWLHRGGHLMGWASELGRPIKLVDAENLPGPS